MKKKLFLSSSLVLTSLISLVGCSSAEEQQKAYKKEVKDINERTENKFEEEYEKDKFAFTFKGDLDGGIKGNLTSYTSTIDSSTGNVTKSEPKTTPFDAKLTSEENAILSLDTAYYRSLNTSSKKEDNESYAYVSEDTKLEFMDEQSKNNGIASYSNKAQVLLKDGLGTYYTNTNGTNENGGTFSYVTYDNYVSLGISTLDQVLLKETTSSRIEELRKLLKTYVALNEQGQSSTTQTLSYIDLICDILQSITSLSTKEEITSDDIMSLLEDGLHINMDKEHETNIREILTKLLPIIKEANLITISKEDQNGLTNYKYTLNYENLLPVLKETLTIIKPYYEQEAIDEVEVLSIENRFKFLNSIIDDTLKNAKVEQVLTFTIKDNLLSSVSEDFKVADFILNDVGVTSIYDSNTGMFSIMFMSLELSELSFTTSYSFSFDAVNKDNLPEVKVITTTNN